MRTFVAVISGLLLASPALAQTTSGYTGSGAQLSSESAQAPAEASSSGGEAPTGERQICRRVETATGSRMSYRRLCMTAQQWRSFNRSDR